jgi:hypothetical protein
MQQLDFFNTLEQTKPICPICGNGFERAKRKPKQVYCSNKCYKKFYSEANKEKIKEYKKEYIKAYRGKQNENSKAYRERNKEYFKAYDKAYREKNKEKIKERKRANKEKSNEKRRKYSKKKWKTDTNFKLRHILRNRIRDALKRQNKSGVKSENTIKLLGCSVIEARKHLEKQFKEGMTWENHAHDTWHIDHIIPCASFDLTDPEQQNKCFHYTNLQPLWAEENMSKSAKIF